MTDIQAPHAFWLGRIAYASAWNAMREFTNQRDGATIDQFWVLEHPPVFTQGLAGRSEYVIDPGSIPVIASDRGGQITYHGPGQMIVYLLIDLRRRGKGIRWLVESLEQGVIATLADLGIQACADAKRPGVYVQDHKIASLGLRVRHGCTYHGLALNVEMDLQPFQRIHPCGYASLSMTQISDWRDPPSWLLLAAHLTKQLALALEYHAAPVWSKRSTGIELPFEYQGYPHVV